MKPVELCLSIFRNSLQQTLPGECIMQNLSVILSSGSKFPILKVNHRQYLLHNNVHIVAIGKAACGMVYSAEHILKEHLIDGIASVPVGSEIPRGLKTQFLMGAVNNLPDEDALQNSDKIVKYLENIRLEPDQIVLFLISGGGSALLTSPLSGITLDEKLEVIRTVVHNGADIKQLNIVRTALSKLKGGKLAKIGAPSKMIGLIASDVINDPMDLIASGPTVTQKSSTRTVFDVLDELNITSRIPNKIIEILIANEKASEKYTKNQVEVDVYNTIICNNNILLKTLEKKFCDNNLTSACVVTSNLEGDATELGIRFANLIIKISTHLRTKSINFSDEIGSFLTEFSLHFEPSRFYGWLLTFIYTFLSYIQNQKGDSSHIKQIAFLFGGESTVRFPAQVPAEAKGGRNQELVLSAFKQLTQSILNSNPALVDGGLLRFALFSLGTDGQDGPTDATGAFIANSDIQHFNENFAFNFKNVEKCLNEKRSYQFWSQEWKNGENLVKLGKTGNNLMDVQILFLKLD